MSAASVLASCIWLLALMRFHKFLEPPPPLVATGRMQSGYGPPAAHLTGQYVGHGQGLSAIVVSEPPCLPFGPKCPGSVPESVPENGGVRGSFPMEFWGPSGPRLR